MITINKQCVDDYTTYNQLKKKLETLENSLAYINQKEPDITWFIHHMELQRLKIISLYTDNKELIDKNRIGSLVLILLSEIIGVIYFQSVYAECSKQSG